MHSHTNSGKGLLPYEKDFALSGERAHFLKRSGFYLDPGRHGVCACDRQCSRFIFDSIETTTREMFFFFCCVSVLFQLAPATARTRPAVVGYLPEWRYDSFNFYFGLQTITHLIFFSIEVAESGKLMALGTKKRNPSSILTLAFHIPFFSPSLSLCLSLSLSLSLSLCL